MKTRGKFTLFLGDDCQNPTEELDVFSLEINGTWSSFTRDVSAITERPGSGVGSSAIGAGEDTGGLMRKGTLPVSIRSSAEENASGEIWIPHPASVEVLLRMKGMFSRPPFSRRTRWPSSESEGKLIKSIITNPTAHAKRGGTGDLCDIQCTHCYLGGVCDNSGICSCSLNINPNVEEPFLGPVDSNQFCAPKGWGTIRSPDGSDPLVKAPTRNRCRELSSISCSAPVISSFSPIIDSVHSPKRLGSVSFLVRTPGERVRGYTGKSKRTGLLSE